MNEPIRQIRERKTDILLILATAVLLALAINSATSYVAAITPDRPVLLLLFSVAFLFAAILLLKRIAFGPTEHVIRLRGAIGFNVENENIHPIKIIGYSFNDDFCEYLRGFIRENKAYAKLFSKRETDVVSMDQFNPDDLNHYTIINSVLEFIVLHQLQLHLNSYFVENEIDKRRIVTLSRDQLGDGVLRNRVIDLITKDMKERTAFARDSDSETEGVVFYAPGENGSVYQRLELEVPSKSRLFRNNNGFVVIANPLFDLTIVPQYEGFVTSLPYVFTPSVQGHFSPLLVTVKMCIHIKNTAFVAGESMEMYEWLDSFVDRMHDYVSTDRLEQRLDPDLIELLKS